MVSDFLIAHPEGPFFSLTTAEFEAATKKFPKLLEPSDISFVANSASAGLRVGYEGYFDNEDILEQCERLFQMIVFKKAFQGHDIELVVDNARTHCAKDYSINDFGKKIGTRCPVEFIEYVDDQGCNVAISCYFTHGEHQGKSKGLLNLARELNIDVPDSIKLNDLKNILAQHRSFQNVNDIFSETNLSYRIFQVTKLERLASTYNVKVIFTPKYHCELNPIEGLWCSMKRYVRTNGDQSFNTMMKLIPMAREHFIERRIHLKLIRRFWTTMVEYDRGTPYEDVLKLFFSNLCKSQIISHRRIPNTI